jgi:hypothetical protein
MPDRPFRFGVIGAPFGKAERWRATAVRAAELGYATLLMPDVLNLLAPGPTSNDVYAQRRGRRGVLLYFCCCTSPFRRAK